MKVQKNTLDAMTSTPRNHHSLRQSETDPMVPRPLRRPVECWQPVVSATERGLDFMVKHGIKGIVGGGSAFLAEKSIVAFRDAKVRAGIEAELGEDMCVGIVFHLAPTREQAIEEARPYFEEHVKMFGPLNMTGPLNDEQLAAINSRGGWDRTDLLTIERMVDAGAWYCGPPDDFVAYLKGLEERYPGLEAVNVQSSMGTPQSVMIEQLEWFAKEAMPAFG